MSMQRAAALGRFALSQVRAAGGQHAILVKNSGALAFGTGITAIFGFAYWLLAARIFPPAAIGKVSALLSLMGLVGLIGDAGLGTLLAGEIVRLPRRGGGLIAAATITSLALSLVAGTAGLVLSVYLFDAFGGLGAPIAAGFWFLAGCGLTGVCFIIDQALLGMLRTPLRMIRQLLFSVGKLILIAIVAVWSRDASAILFSWVASIMLSLVLVELLARRSGGPPLIQWPDFSLLLSLRRRAADHYLLDLTSQTPTIILPYLVTVLLSPTKNAAFYALWMVFTIASVAPAAVATVLFPVVRAEPSQYRDKMVFSLIISLSFAVAFGLFIFFFSGTVLRVFNPTFAQIAGSDLRFLGFGMIGAVVKFQVCAGARLANTMRRAAGWYLVGAAIELGGAALGCQLGGFEGLAVGWVAAILIEATGLVLMALNTTGWALALPDGADRITSEGTFSD